MSGCPLCLSKSKDVLKWANVRRELGATVDVTSAYHRNRAGPHHWLHSEIPVTEKGRPWMGSASMKPIMAWASELTQLRSLVFAFCAPPFLFSHSLAHLFCSPQEQLVSRWMRAHSASGYTLAASLLGTCDLLHKLSLLRRSMADCTNEDSEHCLTFVVQTVRWEEQGKIIIISFLNFKFKFEENRYNGPGLFFFLQLWRYPQHILRWFLVYIGLTIRVLYLWCKKFILMLSQTY